MKDNRVRIRKEIIEKAENEGYQCINSYIENLEKRLQAIKNLENRQFEINSVKQLVNSHLQIANSQQKEINKLSTDIQDLKQAITALNNNLKEIFDERE